MISTPELIMRGKGTTDDNNNLLQTAAKQIVLVGKGYRAICVSSGVNVLTTYRVIELRKKNCDDI